MKINRFKLVLLRIIESNPITIMLMYVFNKKFNIELKAILAGRIKFVERMIENSGNTYQLRRNIHRIEKGLCFSPRKETFGDSYIEETINLFEIAVEKLGADNVDVNWANNILEEYFKTIKKDDLFIEHEKRFENYKIQNNCGLTPNKHKDLGNVTLNIEDLEQLFKHRKSVRTFKDIKAPSELIVKALEISCCAPSACNRQPYFFYCSNDEEEAKDIANLALGTSGWIKNISTIIVVIGDLSAYESERDRHCIYIDSSLASMQFLLALETLGLSTCCINWPEIRTREIRIRKLLGLRNYERPIMMIAVGYAVEEGFVPYSQKKSNILLQKDNSFDK